MILRFQWYLLLLIKFILQFNFLVAIAPKEIINFSISCFKYENLKQNILQDLSCYSDNSLNNFNNCIDELINQFQNQEKNYITEITNLTKNINNDHIQNNYKEILNSTKLFLTLNQVKETYINSDGKELKCPLTCDQHLNKAISDIKLKKDFLINIKKEICKIDYFNIKTCIEIVESNIDKYLDENKQELFQRSTSLKICYNIGKELGRNQIYLSHILDLIAFNSAFEEQLGITLSQIIDKDLFELQLDKKIIYIFDSIRQFKLKKIYYGNKKLFKRSDLEDVLSNDYNNEILYSFAECLMASDLILKFYLVPTLKSTNLCKLFFNYRGALISNEEIYQLDDSKLLEIAEIREKMKNKLDYYLKDIELPKENLINLNRFNLFKCLDFLSNKKLQFNILNITNICFSIFKNIEKDLVDLFDINVGIYTSIILKWLTYAVKKDIIIINNSFEKKIYMESIGRYTLYSLLIAMGEEFNIIECKRHLETLNNYKFFINQNNNINEEIPFFRYINPRSINKEYINIICNEESIIFGILSQIGSLREFLTITQPTKILIKNSDNSEYSKFDSNLIGTKDIFDATLQLYYAGDVPRGYLMDAVSFSIVGLKAFLRNTLNFLSQETIMNRYDEINKGLSFITPFNDILTIMGISGSYNNLLNTQEQIYYTEKYICSGSSENIEIRVSNSNIVKYIGHPFSLLTKELKNNSNMFDFINCVDQYILSNWKNERYSILKSDPILFCSKIAIYLARDYNYIQEEIKKYAIYIAYYEMTGNALPEKCIQVSFINIPFLKDIENEQILSNAFKDCIEKYSLIHDFLTKDEILSLSISFSKSVLEFVDKPMAFHSSSMYRRLLLYVLNKHPGIGKEKALYIISSLNPIYGFDYSQLISKLTENNISLKESAIITGFVGNRLEKNNKKLPFQLINWLGDYSGIYIPFENNPGLRENILKLFLNNKYMSKDECKQNISKIFEKFQIPNDNKTNLICEEWRKLFENYPDEDIINSYIDWIDKNTNLNIDNNSNENINLNITKIYPEFNSINIKINDKNNSIISIMPILYEKNFIDPMKEILQGFELNSKTIILDKDKNMELTFKELNIKDGDNLLLIIQNLQPEIIDLKIIWKDINTKNQGNFTLNIENTHFDNFIKKIYKHNDLFNRSIKSIILPNGKIIESEINNDHIISDLGIKNSDLILLNTILNNVELLNLKLFWRNPSILNIIPSINDEENIIHENIQIYSNDLFGNFLNEIKSILMKNIFKDKQVEIEYFDINSIEILNDNESIPNIISNLQKKINIPIFDLNIKNNNQILINIDIKPVKTFNIIFKSEKISYIVYLTSIPYKYDNNEPYFGLYQVLNTIIDKKLESYDIIISKKYFINEKELNIKSNNINITNHIKTFDSVKKLKDGANIILNNKNSIKKDELNLLIILKENPDINKFITFKNSMFPFKILELLNQNFNDIIPKSFFTIDGNEINLYPNNKRINFNDFSIKNNDILYLITDNSFILQDSNLENNNEISFYKVKELLLSYGLKIDNNINIEKFDNIEQVEQFIKNNFLNINIERLISEYQDNLYKIDYKFPTIFERLNTILNEDLIFLKLNNNSLINLYKYYGLIDEEENDFFDFLNCIRAFRNLYFYNRPEKKIYTANIYNICNKIGHFLFRKEKWLKEQSYNSVLIATLEEHLVHPINIKKEGKFLKSIQFSDLDEIKCIKLLKEKLKLLKIYSDEILNLEIPYSIIEENICISIKAYFSEIDNLNGEYNQFVELLPAYLLSQEIDKTFPIIWEENAFGITLPIISEIKQSINPLFNLRNIFLFIQKYLEIYSQQLKDDYPDCIIITSILIIRNILINSKISPEIFLRKIVQFAFEEEYKEYKELKINMKEIINILSKNKIIFSKDLKYKKGDIWIWDTIKNNKQFIYLKDEMKYSYKYLLLFDNYKNLCPVTQSQDNLDNLLDDDIKLLINYFIKQIKNESKIFDSIFSKELLIEDLINISSKLDNLNIDKFYKIIKHNIIYIINKNDEELKKIIGYSNVKSYDYKFVPFIVTFKILSNIYLGEISEKDILKRFLRFLIYEGFFNLGIIIGNIEIEYLIEKIINNFDWNNMSISSNYMKKFLNDIFPINSAIFIKNNDETINEISELFLNIFESNNPIQSSEFDIINLNHNINLFPRVNLFNYLDEKSFSNEKYNIELINKIIIEKGYPKNLGIQFNEYLNNYNYIHNNEIIHVSRLGKTILNIRQKHIYSILLSYGYTNIQTSLLLNNFDHLHCFDSLIEILTDNPRRLDHYYQICMSICIEVNKMNHFECEKLNIETISTILLNEKKDNKLNKLISFLKYDYIFENDIQILREIYIDNKTNRINEKWINLFINMKYYQNFYSIINNFKSYMDEIILEKGLNEPSTGFAFLDLLGEFISLWTRPTAINFIKNIIINQGYNINLLKYFSNIWPGNTINYIQLRISDYENKKIQLLKSSLINELVNNYQMKENKALIESENIIKQICISLNIKFNKFKETFNLKNKSYTYKMIQQGINIDKLYSEIINKKNMSIFLLLEDCINLSLEEIQDFLTLNYSDILLFCINIINEISYENINYINNPNYNEFSIFKSKYSRIEIYQAMSFYALKMSLDYIFQGVISKIKIYEYIFSIKNHLYLLNNELGIKIFVKNFIIQFKLPIDPNILSYYLKEIMINSISTIHINKSEEIKLYQNIPNSILIYKSFYRLIYEISKEIIDPIKDQIEENHFKLLFKRKDIIELINKGFNPISIKYFLSKLTNNSDKTLIYKFGNKLGMNYLSFQIMNIYEFLQIEIDKILIDKNVSKDEKEFFNQININLDLLDPLIYELVNTSKENCIIELINNYSLKFQPLYYGPQFIYADKICQKFIHFIEEFNYELNKVFNPDDYLMSNNCDQIRLINLIENLESEIYYILNIFNDHQLMNNFFELKTFQDLYLQKTFKYIQIKIDKSLNKSKYFNLFNKWNKQINRNIFNQILIRKDIFDQIMKYLNNFVFIITPIIRKISYSFKQEINNQNYQKNKKILCKLLLSIVTITNPYSIPNFIKNNQKMRLEYLNEVNYFKKNKVNQLNKRVILLGVNIYPYYLKICWYIHYLSIVKQEINALINQLPNFSINNQKNNLSYMNSNLYNTEYNMKDTKNQNKRRMNLGFKRMKAKIKKNDKKIKRSRLNYFKNFKKNFKKYFNKK